VADIHAKSLPRGIWPTGSQLLVVRVAQSARFEQDTDSDGGKGAFVVGEAGLKCEAVAG
jgi:hypothetical protein